MTSFEPKKLGSWYTDPYCCSQPSNSDPGSSDAKSPRERPRGLQLLGPLSGVVVVCPWRRISWSRKAPAAAVTRISKVDGMLDGVGVNVIAGQLSDSVDGMGFYACI